MSTDTFVLPQGRVGRAVFHNATGPIGTWWVPAVHVVKHKKRVLVVDIAVNRATLHEQLGLDNSCGLADILTGRSWVRDAIQKTDVPSFFVLTSGTPSEDWDKLLKSEHMQKFVECLRYSAFEHIIFYSAA